MHTVFRHGRQWISKGAGGPVGLIAILGLVSCASSSTHQSSLITPRNYRVLLMPPPQAGFSGWCLAIEEPVKCLPANSYRGPIVAVARDFVRHNSSPDMVGIVLTTNAVSSISAGFSPPIPTRVESVLPSGIRAAVFESSLDISAHTHAIPGITPRDAAGRPIPQSTEPGEPLLRGVASAHKWAYPEHPPHGVCEISGHYRKILTPRWGNVVAGIPTQETTIGKSFVSCAWTEYYMEGWPLEVAVLLDGGKPGATPPPLPAMQPLPGHSDIYQAPIASPPSNGQALARRVPGAWLVVTFGQNGQKGYRQRLFAIQHIHVRVTI